MLACGDDDGGGIRLVGGGTMVGQHSSRGEKVESG
jgi:hypothetical protein